MKPKETLLNGFGTFFLSKLENIVIKTGKIAENKEITSIVDYTSLTANTDLFSEFKELTVSEIRDIIMSPTNKTSP